MTTKDYVRLAAAFRATRPYRYNAGLGTALRETWEKTLIAVMAELADDNHRFDPDQFIRAAHQGDPGFDGQVRMRLNDLRRAYEDQNRLQP